MSIVGSAASRRATRGLRGFAAAALPLVVASALVGPATASAGPPGPAPYPAQMGMWNVPDAGGTGLGWSLAVDRSRHVPYVAEKVTLLRGDGSLEPVVRVRAFTGDGAPLASAEVPSTADENATARPLIAVDGRAGVAYVVTGDTLEAGPSARIVRLSTRPAAGGGSAPSLTPPATGPEAIGLPLPAGPVELKDLAVDPVTHELVLAARTAQSTSAANGGQFVARFDPETGARTALVATDPDGHTGGPLRTRVTVGNDGTIWLLGQQFRTGAPAGVWRFPLGVQDQVVPATPFYASRNVTNPLAPPPGFGIALHDQLDELAPALAVDGSGRLLVPFAGPVATPPENDIPVSRVDTAIGVLDPSRARPISDPAFPGVPFAPIVQLIAGDGVARGGLPFGADAGNYACHPGRDEETTEYDFVVDRETIGGMPSDVLYVLSKSSQTHYGAYVMKIGPRVSGSFSCFAPPYARLGGVPLRSVAPGTTVRLDVRTSIDPNLGDSYLQPRGIFRVEWDLTSDRFAPGDTIVRRQVPLGSRPDTTLDLTVTRDQFVAVRVWNAAGLKSNVRTATIDVAESAAP